MIDWIDADYALPPVGVPVLVFNGSVSIAERDTNDWWYLMANGGYVFDNVLENGSLESITDVTQWAWISLPNVLAPKEQNEAQP